MRLVERVLRLPELRERPPVLVDIGASGELDPRWSALRDHATCIAFDADQRDFQASTARAHPYRVLHLHHHIVSPEPTRERDFFLTRSPHCSSTLPPLQEKLSAYVFAELFDVVEQTTLPARQLPEVLAAHRLGYVDWLKTDSQGTDLRLVLSLGEEVLSRMLSVSFEPGLVDAYEGEDKLHAVLAHMDKLPFWIHRMEVRGTQRLRRELWERELRPLVRSWPLLSLPDSPGWAEVGYLNTLEPDAPFDKRDFLLAWVIATVEQQAGFALEIARRGEQRFGDRLFRQLAEESVRQLASVADRLLPEVAKKVVRALGDLRRRWLGSRSG